MPKIEPCPVILYLIRGVSMRNAVCFCRPQETSNNERIINSTRRRRCFHLFLFMFSFIFFPYEKVSFLSCRKPYILRTVMQPGSHVNSRQATKGIRKVAMMVNQRLQRWRSYTLECERWSRYNRNHFLEGVSDTKDTGKL